MKDAGELRLLILGGTGFIGSSFANWASEQGAKVHVCARSLPRVGSLAPEVDVMLADATEIASMRRAFDHAKPNVVLFAVSQILPRSEQAAAYSSVTAEIKALLNALECISDTGCKRFIYLSSAGAIYGGGPNAFAEDDRCSPKSIYGKLKLQAEQLIAVLAPRAGAKYSILRVSNPFGPGQDPCGSQGVIPIFIYRILRGETVKIFGSDQSRKDYIYIDDLNRGIWRSIAQCNDHLINLGSGTSTKLQALLGLIEAECGKKALTIPSSLESVEVESFALDVSRAETLLRWKAETGLEAGIKKTREWVGTLTRTQC
ncbi:MAG: NAD-dependent epimerase/dehydratase family protein [Acidobacteriaceae bacterium]